MGTSPHRHNPGRGWCVVDVVWAFRQPRRLAARALTENAGSRRRFVHITAAGITFQGGSAAIDSSTIIAALVHQLTGSAVAVGAATTILRVGWLSPQLVIGYLVQRRRVSLPYFIVGGFGRATCLALLACLLGFSAKLPTAWVVTGFFPTGKSFRQAWIITWWERVRVSRPGSRLYLECRSCKLTDCSCSIRHCRRLLPIPRQASLRN